MLLQSVRDGAFRRLMKLSDRWLERAVGKRIRVNGQTLDLQIQALLAAAKLAGVRDEADVRESRIAMDRDSVAVGPSLIAMQRERDFSIAVGDAKLPARLYVPKTAAKTPPLLMYFHGGGFVCGSILSHDPAVRELAHESGVAILSVEYRLAPEHKAPTGPEDGFVALEWARANAASLGTDPERIGVGGDSAGGNLSAVVSHLCKQRGKAQPKVQLLIYPAVDLTCSARSHWLFREGFLLEEARIDWYLRHYVTRDEERTEPHVSPLFEKDFHDLAPAIIVTAGFDPLRAEGAAYA
ncbi:alpha/beta hydrolase [soil metagenome]